MNTPNAQTTSLKAKLFRGFADPSRLSIVESLRAGPLTVSKVIEATGLSQSNVSNHLGCLRECGFVTGEQLGRYVQYQLSDDRIALILRLSEELLVDVAKGISECTRYDVPEEV